MPSPTPIIMGGTPSSGSTMLVNIIGRNKSIFQCGELTVFDKVEWLKSPDLLSYRAFRDKGERRYPRRFGCEMGDHLSNLDEALVHDTFGATQDEDKRSYLENAIDLMDHLGKGAGSSQWVEKTPSNIFGFPYLSSRCPHWKFVATVRDPRSVLSSLSKRGFSASMAATRWYLPSLIGHALRERENVMIVRYEDIVQDYDATAAKLSAFIDAELPGLSEMDHKPDAEQVGSWSASASAPPQRSGLWSESKTVPDAYLATLAKIRPAPDFLEEIGVSAALQPDDLARALGYDFDWSEESCGAFSRVDYYREYLRYAARMVGTRHAPRPSPVRFS